MADTIIHNHTIDKSIQQLRETTTQHQTAINTIHSTLAYHQTIIDSHQNSIADIKTSINHIVHNLSDIATKLGLQITLPPPLPLSPAPSTPLSIAVLGFTTPLPSSNSANLPSLISSTTASALTPARIEIPISTVLTPCTNNLKIDNSRPCSPLLFFSSRHDPPRQPIIQSLGPALQPDEEIPFPNTPEAVLETDPFHVYFTKIKSDDIFINIGCCLIVGFCNAFISSFLQKNRIGNAHSLFVERNGQPTIFEKALFVFDPGGIFSIESYDLEDKVVFEGMVMIGFSVDMHTNMDGTAHDDATVTRPRGLEE